MAQIIKGISSNQKVHYRVYKSPNKQKMQSTTSKVPDIRYTFKGQEILAKRRDLNC
jgi:hypothetical protein